MIPPSRTRVFLALVDVYQNQGRATTRQVMNAAGLSSSHSAWSQLVKLRRDGLVSWQDRRSGTLRPLYRPVKWRGSGRACVR